MRHFLLLFLVITACEPLAELRESVEERTPHERYAGALERAGLDQTALGRDWMAAAERALRAPTPVDLPFSESGYFAPTEAGAMSVRFEARGGQTLVIVVEQQGTTPFNAFLDLWELEPEADSLIPDHVESAEGARIRLTVEAGDDATYLLRLQPELLRGGRYTVSVHREPTLAFPVEGRTSQAVKSFFGAPRDGGRRSHHGIDIFAPRGTPVIAAADGVIRRVHETRLGGRVVWLSDVERGQSLYYAHLDTQLVASGSRVRAGDTLGLIGNSGNAMSTAPHLHFGIYRRGRGPVDPYPYVHDLRERPPAVVADTGRLGSRARVTARAAELRRAPDGEAPSIARLDRLTVVEVLAASRGWYRVRTPDGSGGYLLARQLESAARPVRRELLSEPAPLRDSPLATAAVMDSVAGSVPILGRFGPYLLIETRDGRTGWVEAD